MGTFSNLPEEITSDILSRLPAQSVGLCRCVSKPWRALLSHPKFIKTHLHRTTTVEPQSLLAISDVLQGMYLSPFRSAHHLFDEITLHATRVIFAQHPCSWTHIHGSCDGLVLVEDKDCNLFVLNPVTREIREVPRSPFGLDPNESFTMYGFGCDLGAGGYKVVSISYYDTDNECGYTGNEDEPFCTEMFVNVYSLKNGAWKRVESSPYDHVVGHVTPGVFVHGRIHWLACRKPDYESVIVGFDLVEERFCEVPAPSSVDGGKFVFNHLAVLGGCLCMFKETQTVVWVMKEYGVQESWTDFMINLPEEAEIRPICMLGKEELLLEIDEQRLVMYNLDRGTGKDVVVYGLPEDLLGVTTFMESLVSPHGDKETGIE